MITTTPNGVVSPIHDRMPVLLRPEDYDKWLDSRTSLDELQALLKPSPDNELTGEGTMPSPNREPGLFD